MGTDPDSTAPHAFLSYVREDAETVDRIQAILEAAGVRVWRDTEDLWPGEDWGLRIRDAIQRNALVFIAVFSEDSARRTRSYQNEELHLAIEELRRRRPDQPWLIPVRLNDIPLPSFDIAPGRALDSLQYVDLFGEQWETGASRLVAGVLRILESFRAQPSDHDLSTRSPEPTRTSLRETFAPLEATRAAQFRSADAVRVDYLRPSSFFPWERNDDVALEFRTVVATTRVETERLRTATRHQFRDLVVTTKWTELLQAWEQKWHPGAAATRWDLEGSNDQWTATAVWLSRRSPFQARMVLGLPRPSPHGPEGVVVIMDQRVRIQGSADSGGPEVGEPVSLTEVYWVLDALLVTCYQLADSQLLSALVDGDAWGMKLPAASLTARDGDVSRRLTELILVDQQRFDDAQPLRTHVPFQGDVPLSSLDEPEVRHDLIVEWLTSMLTNMHYKAPEQLTKDLPH